MIGNDGRNPASTKYTLHPSTTPDEDGIGDIQGIIKSCHISHT
jgi:hypothetical protein